MFKTYRFSTVFKSASTAVAYATFLQGVMFTQANAESTNSRFNGTLVTGAQVQAESISSEMPTPLIIKSKSNPECFVIAHVDAVIPATGRVSIKSESFDCKGVRQEFKGFVVGVDGHAGAPAKIRTYSDGGQSPVKAYDLAPGVAVAVVRSKQ